jgi:hypothetical protein
LKLINFGDLSHKSHLPKHKSNLEKKTSVLAESRSNLNRIQTWNASHIPAQPQRVAQQAEASERFVSFMLLPSPLFISDPNSFLQILFPNQFLHVSAARPTLASSSRRLAAPACHCSPKSGVPGSNPAAGRRI